MNDFDFYKPNTHPDSLVTDITYLYIVSIILWIFLVYILDLISTDLISFIILLIPIIMYLITIYTIEDSDRDLEKEFLQSDILAFSVIIITVILNLEKNRYSPFFSKLMTVGLILLMFSFIDFWVNKCEYLYVRHIKSILRIAAMTIFAYVLYVYHILDVKHYGHTVNPLKENKNILI